MAQIACDDCQMSVSTSAAKCPNCDCPVTLPSDVELFEFATTARDEASLAGLMAVLWSLLSVASFLFGQNHPSLATTAVWFFATTAAAYHIIRRGRYKRQLRAAERMAGNGQRLTESSQDV